MTAPVHSTRLPAGRKLLALAGLAAAYFVAGKLGLRLAFAHPSATPVWAPTGIALTAFLFAGPRVWPAIYVGAFFVNLTTAGNVWTSFGIALGNTLEGVLGAWLVRRWGGWDGLFQRASGVFRFALLAAGLSTTVSATLGVASLALGGFARWSDFGSVWTTWWLGDIAGAIVVAPFLIVWIQDRRVAWNAAQRLEALGLLAALLLTGQFVFGGLFPSVTLNYPLEFLCLPILVWAAFRFTTREVATATLLLSAIAIAGTVRGLGPFVRATPNESLLLLQAFLCATSLTSLVLATVVGERRQMIVELQRLSVSDPLTGLANYRRLIDNMEEAINRSQRTGRPVAVVLFDLDQLKKINDRYGHLVGSRALCRLADALRATCRVVDTAGRFGGDEFALVLHEADRPAAQRVAQRVAERLRSDTEKPAISASFGIAVYPGDGEAVEPLLTAADRALYLMKRHGGRVRA